MPRVLPPAFSAILEQQRGVISRQQALACGIDTDVIGRLLRAERWQPLQRGVYAVFTGRLDREAELWAALARAGPESMLSHETAAELHGLTDAASALIHVTIPATRRVRPISGIILHHSARAHEAVHPVLQPPRTRVEETVLDLVQQSATPDRAFALACAACQRRLTTTHRLLAAMTMRSKLRWRAELAELLGDVAEGAHTPLELRYVRGVERPHGLPKATRQARITRNGRNSYLDNSYDNFGLIVELDGAIAHPDDRRWRDKRRDNAALADGCVTLRYGWLDVTTRPCETAMQVAEVLRSRGWTGQLVPCRTSCPVRAQRRA